MPHLPSIICPCCRKDIAAMEYIDKAPAATRFDDCLRRCERCGIAVSNAVDPGDVTYIHLDPLRNIPKGVVKVQARP
jgi:hypothetical protein